MRQWIVFKKEYFWALIIAAIVIVIYGPGLSGPFVFDDFPTFVHNHKFQVDNLSFNSISQALSSSKTGLTSRPVALLSLLINYHHFGLNPLSYKLVNVFIHLINGLILFCALKIFFGLYQLNRPEFFSAKKISGIIVAIWLFHPLNLTSVLYVVQRMASLSCTFMLICFYTYLLIRKNQLLNKKENIWYYFLFLLSLILGFLAKDNAIIILGIIFITEIIFFKGESSKIISRRLLKLSINFGWLCCVSLVMLIIWKWQWLEDSYVNRSFTLNERLLTEARAVWLYVQLILIPNIGKMHLFHDNFIVSKSIFYPISTFYAIFAWGFLLIFSWFTRKKSPLIIYGILWFFVGHSIESTFISLELIHEHRNYFPMIGLFISVIGVVGVIQKRFLNINEYYFINYIIILFLASGTFVRAQSWQDIHTLYRSEVQKNPESTRAQIAAGNSYFISLVMEEDQNENSDNYVRARYHLEQAYKNNKNDLSGLLELIKLNEIIKQNPDEFWLNELESRLSKLKIDNENMVKIDEFLKCNINLACKSDISIINRIASAIEENKTFTPLSRAIFNLRIAQYLIKNNLVEPAVYYLKKVTDKKIGDKKKYLDIAVAFSEIGYKADAIEVSKEIDINDLNDIEKKIFLQLKNNLGVN